MTRQRLAGKVLRRRRYCPWCPIAKWAASWAARQLSAKSSHNRRYVSVVKWVNKMHAWQAVGFNSVSR